MGIEASTNVLVGRWLNSGDTVRGDDTCRRINSLIESGELKKVAQSSDGWSVLYLDSSDGRLWELTYPESGTHSGGPPKLSVIPREAALARYGGLSESAY